MTVPDVLDGGAVTRHIALHAPAAAGQGVQIEDAGRCGHMIHGIIRRHDGGQMLVLDEPLVRIEIELPHVPAVHIGAAHMAVEFTVVGKIVLGGGDGLHVAGIRTHEAAHESAGHFRSQERIFTVRFSRTAPAGITDGFHHRRPEGKALGAGLVDGAGFFRHGRCHALHQRRVPGRAQSHAIGEGSGTQDTYGRVGAGEHAMQRLTPHVVILHAQTGHGGHIVAQQALLFLQRKAGNQVRSALLKGIGGVEVNWKGAVIGILRPGGNRKAQGQDSTGENQ